MENKEQTKKWEVTPLFDNLCDMRDLPEIEFNVGGDLYLQSVIPTTNVIFRMEDGKPIAFFPNKEETNGKIRCYTIKDGYSSALKEYVKQCPSAKTKQFLPLYNHLTSIGYKLKVKTIRALK